MIKYDVNWKKVDWSRSTAEISSLCGVPKHLVSKKRRIYAPDTLQKSRKYPLCEVDWDSVDWSKKTRDIAAEHKTSPARVSQARAKYSPETLQGKWRSKKDQAFADIDWNRPNKVIAKEFGIAVKSLWYYRAKYAPETIKPSLEPDVWQAIDWTKTNDEIAEELDRHPVYVSKMRGAHGKCRRLAIYEKKNG